MSAVNREPLAMIAIVASVAKNKGKCPFGFKTQAAVQ